MTVLVLVALALAVLLIWAVRRSSQAVAPAAAAYTMHFPGDGDYETEVVGESHHQEALSAICGGRTEDGHELECEATLRLEPDNPHDANAVGVWIEGRKVGFLARPMARAFTNSARRHALSEATCDALIVGGWDRGARGSGHFGVKLDLFEEEDEEEDDELRGA